MKILIVDDEELTRSGLVSSIDWASLGIREVLQAEDGRQGLETARAHRPEIILCDVRMPRMDGITMLKKLEEILPDSIPIFMSGYSDKEYLKAAIRLKAVSYIEKPLNPREVQDAIREAKGLYEQKMRTHRGDAIHSQETAAALAAALTAPYSAGREKIDALCAELSYEGIVSCFFTALIVRLRTDAQDLREQFAEIRDAFAGYLKSMHLNAVSVERHAEYLIYHIFGPQRPSGSALALAAEFLGNQFPRGTAFYMAAGDTVAGIQKAYQSYASAVILLQSGFFFPQNTFLTAGMLEELPTRTLKGLPENPESVFLDYLLGNDSAGCRELLSLLFSCFDRNHSLLANQVRDLYYRLFAAIRSARKQKLVAYRTEDQEDSIMEALESVFSYRELHALLQEKTESFFADRKEAVPENSTIFQIKEYIGKNYMDDTLSVKEISSHVFLSVSYVCTFFKNETGQTLNQYLTEYRMEKAKQLLSDPRYKIADISAKVGYNDGNYFGKSFKKYTGLSPSEYRDKMS